MSKVYGILAAGAGIVVTPTIPDQPVLDQNIVGTVTFHWPASLQGTFPIAGYQILRNGAPLTTTSQLSFTDHTISPLGPYTYSLAAFDNQGNNSGIGPGLSLTAAAATAPPPSWSSIPAQSVQTNQAFTLELSSFISNPGGKALTYAAIDALYAGLSLNAATGRVSGTVTGSGSSTCRFSVNDGVNAAVVSAAVTFAGLTPDVTGPPPPIALSIVSQTATQVVIQGLPVSDPDVPGAIWSGMKQINFKRGGAVIGTIPMPAGDRTALSLFDIGSPSPASTLLRTGADYTLTTSGSNQYGLTDQFAYAAAQKSGTSWVMWTKIEAFTGANQFAKANLTIRADLSLGSDYIDGNLNPIPPGAGFNSEMRAAAANGGTASATTRIPNSTLPAWLVTTRALNVFSVYYTIDGLNLVLLSSNTLPALGNTVYVGLGLTSSQVGSSVSCTFKQFNFSSLAAWQFTDNTIGPNQHYSFTASGTDLALNEGTDSAALAVSTVVVQPSTVLYPRYAADVAAGAQIYSSNQAQLIAWAKHLDLLIIGAWWESNATALEAMASQMVAGDGVLFPLIVMYCLNNSRFTNNQQAADQISTPILYALLQKWRLLTTGGATVADPFKTQTELVNRTDAVAADGNGNQSSAAFAKYMSDRHLTGSGNDNVPSISGFWQDVYAFPSDGGNGCNGNYLLDGVNRNWFDAAVWPRILKGARAFSDWFKANKPTKKVFGNLSFDVNIGGQQLFLKSRSSYSDLDQQLNASMCETFLGTGISSQEQRAGLAGAIACWQAQEDAMTNPENGQWTHYLIDANGKDARHSATNGQACRYGNACVLTILNGCYLMIYPLTAKFEPGGQYPCQWVFDWMSVDLSGKQARCINYYTASSAAYAAGRKWMGRPLESRQSVKRFGSVYGRLYQNDSFNCQILSLVNGTESAAQTVNLATAGLGSTWQALSASGMVGYGAVGGNAAVDNGATNIGSLSVPAGDARLLVKFL